jgi:hypothetical protein
MSLFNLDCDKFKPKHWSLPIKNSLTLRRRYESHDINVYRGIINIQPDSLKAQFCQRDEPERDC